MINTETNQVLEQLVDISRRAGLARLILPVTS